MDPKERPRLHARDHLPGGADPLDLLEFLSLGGASTYESGVMSLSSLVGYWRLGDGASPYADTSGFAPTDSAPMVKQTRTVALTPHYTPGSPIVDDDGAVKFNGEPDLTGGTGDFLEALPASSDISRFWFPANDPFTVGVRVNAEAAAVSHLGSIFSTVHVTGFGGPGARDDGWRIDIEYPSRIVGFTRAVDVETGDPYDSARTPAGLVAGSDYLIVGVYDGVDLLLYVNGTLIATAPSAGSMPGSTSASNPTLGIGANNQGNEVGFFKGVTDEAAVWSRALDAGEVAFLWGSGNVPAAGSEIVGDGSGGFTIEPPRIVYLNGA